MDDFFAANKIVVIRGLLCSDAVLQHDYTTLIASMQNDNWTKDQQVHHFEFYTWKRNFIPDLSTLLFFDEYGNIQHLVQCYGTHQSLREFLRN